MLINPPVAYEGEPDIEGRSPPFAVIFTSPNTPLLNPPLAVKLIRPRFPLEALTSKSVKLNRLIPPSTSKLTALEVLFIASAFTIISFEDVIPKFPNVPVPLICDVPSVVSVPDEPLTFPEAEMLPDDVVILPAVVVILPVPEYPEELEIEKLLPLRLAS
jgi:hypothetical protein